MEPFRKELAPRAFYDPMENDEDPGRRELAPRGPNSLMWKPGPSTSLPVAVKTVAVMTALVMTASPARPAISGRLQRSNEGDPDGHDAQGPEVPEGVPEPAVDEAEGIGQQQAADQDDEGARDCFRRLRFLYSLSLLPRPTVLVAAGSRFPSISGLVSARTGPDTSAGGTVCG